MSHVSCFGDRRIACVTRHITFGSLPRMRCRFFILLLLASALFQSMASAGQGFVVQAMDGVAHVHLHAQDAPHHHDDDGALHEDDSDQSVRHLQADNALNLVALPSLAVPMAREAAPQPVLFNSFLEVPPPVLAGPTRPPRPAG